MKILREDYRLLHRTLMTLVVVMTIALPTTGCTRAADDTSLAESLSENAGRNTPPIHLEQTDVMLKNGVPLVERQYRDALAACRQVPTMPTTALSEEVAGKLGRTYWSIDYLGNRMAARIDEWNYTNAAFACRFEPMHEARLWIFNEKGESTTIDLNSGKGETEERGTPRHDPVPNDSGDLATNEAVHMDQRCVRRSDTITEECVWSGGRQWGFETDMAGVGANTGYIGDHIVLWAKPLNGSGLELTTQKMTVGTPIDDKVFKLPPNIAISKAN